MNADFILGLSRFKIHLLSGPSDLADRFTYQLSCTILIVMCTLVTLKQYYSTMIQCIFPTEYNIKNIDDYAANLCWAENTFFVKGKIQAGQSMTCAQSTMEGAQVINYYKWVPFMLVSQCLLCYLPHLLWKMFHPKSGLNVKMLISNAVNAANSTGENAEKNLVLVARSLSDALYVQREYRNNCFYRLRQLCGAMVCCCGGKRVGNFLTTLYLFIKLVYIVNAMAQLWMMAAFLGLPVTYGAQLLQDLHAGNNWNVTGVFPRVTICKFAVQFGNLQYIDLCAQCVIPINFLLEGMYIVLWFWFVLVLIISGYSLATWIARLVPNTRRHFVKKYFKLLKLEGDVSKSRRDHFIESHLRSDGVLALRLIAENTGELCVSELVKLIWQRYLERLRSANCDARGSVPRKIAYDDTEMTIRGGEGHSKVLDDPDSFLSDVQSSGIGSSGTMKKAKSLGYSLISGPPDYAGASAPAPPSFVDEVQDSGVRTSSCSSGHSDFQQASPNSILSRVRRQTTNNVSKV